MRGFITLRPRNPSPVCICLNPSLNASLPTLPTADAALIGAVGNMPAANSNAGYSSPLAIPVSLNPFLKDSALPTKGYGFSSSPLGSK